MDPSFSYGSNLNMGVYCHDQMAGSAGMYPHHSFHYAHHQKVQHPMKCYDGSRAPPPPVMPAPVVEVPPKKARNPRKPRTAFTDAQLIRLEGLFSQNDYLDRPQRETLAKELNLTEFQVKIWFQNKRAKVKKAASQPAPSTSKKEKENGPSTSSTAKPPLQKTVVGHQQQPQWTPTGQYNYPQQYGHPQQQARLQEHQQNVYASFDPMTGYSYNNNENNSYYY